LAGSATHFNQLQFALTGRDVTRYSELLNKEDNILMSDNNIWPKDIDGDILRLLEERGFDFNLAHEIEFIIDFKCWPLSKERQYEVLGKLPQTRFVEADEELIEEGDPSGYVSFTVKNTVSYDFITFEMKRLSSLFANMDGVCDSWSVTSGCGT